MEEFAAASSGDEEFAAASSGSDAPGGASEFGAAGGSSEDEVAPDKRTRGEGRRLKPSAR